MLFQWYEKVPCTMIELLWISCVQPVQLKCRTIIVQRELWFPSEAHSLVNLKHTYSTV